MSMSDDQTERQPEASVGGSPGSVEEVIHVMQLKRRLHGVPDAQLAADRRTYERRLAAIEKRKRQR